MNITSNYFTVNQENPEKEEDLRILNNINSRKKITSKYKIDKYEKFNPRPKIEIAKIDSTILTAENNVKILLSTFLHELKAEQKKEEYTNNNTKAQLKTKKTKTIKKKDTTPNKKNSSNMITDETAVINIKKINTVSGNNYYKNENKSNLNQSPSPFKKRTNTANSKSLFLNSNKTIKDNLSNLNNKLQKNFDPDILMNNNIEKTEGLKTKNNNVVTSMNDLEKDCKCQTNSGKKPQKYKKVKTKFKKSSKKSFKPVIRSSLYLKFDLNSIINEKLLKLTEDIRERMAIEEMLKESKDKNSIINNNNFQYCYSYFTYFKNNTKNSVFNYCSNFSDKAKSESNSPKKDFFINNINKIEKNENINDSPFKSIISNGKGNFNEYTQRTKSYFSSRISNNFIPKKKDIKIETLKDLKEKIRNTIILRPEELNLEDDLDINNSQNTIIYNDKEKTQRSKVNFSSDNKNTDSNLSNTNQNINKKLIKNKFDNKDLIINNKINKNLDNFSSNENEKQNQEKESSYSLGRVKTKKEIINENFRILTYKKLVYDSFDDEEVEEEYNNKYIHPDSLFIKIFDNIIIILAFSELINIPYYLASTGSFCKNYKKLGYLINVFVEFLYILDFIFGFFKAYYNFEEQLITNNISIIKKYLINWFLLDLISALPLYSYLKIKEPSCQNHNNIHPYDEKIHNLHYLIILNKLLKIFKFNFINHNFIHLFNKFGLNSTVLIELLVFLSGLHFFSCLHIFIGRNSYPNWILQSKLENKKFSDLYISSVYSIIVSITTVGYGDIVCHSFPERIFQIFLLILGCIAYSWFISSFSSYIQKHNEKFVDFKNRKQILDEIKYHYPKISNDLYERILRFIKYKNCNEKRDKNIIFDCLPIGLKNNLVYEMYKPIIKNFIFFKNFDNFDFIVRVILAFRPILAYKNDILLNEGDIVNDILFVKKGMLSLQIPINIKNPEEYIDKYLYGNNFEQSNQKNSFLNSGNQSIFERKNNNTFTSIILQKNYNKMSFLNLTEKEDLFNRLKKKEEENERKKNTRYIKIVSIRQNEHFGDVLMFLDQRSPLRVKVTSKKAELFFLKKMDVIKISSSYQSIWRRINKKSVFNYEQIKKSIPKMIELYCKFKGFNVTEVDSKISCIKSPNKNANRRTMLPTTKLKMSALAVKKLKKSLTQIYNKRQIYSYKFFPNKDDVSYDYRNVKTHVIMNSNKNFSSNSDNNDDDDSSDESSESSNKSSNINNSKNILNNKMSNIYNRHYKYYIGSKIVKESYKTLASMINEESEFDTSITSLKASNIIKNKLLEVVKSSINSNNNTQKSLVKSNSGKNRGFSKKMFDYINQNKNGINSKGKRLHMEIINENDEIINKRSKSNLSNNEFIKKRKPKIETEEQPNENQNSLTENSVNEEIHMNEEIEIPINENLMNRNISKSILLDIKNITPIQKINNLDKHSSEKIIYSDISLNKNSCSKISVIDKNNIKMSNNKLDYNKKIFSNQNLITDSIITNMQIISIYDNLNSINNKYYLNKDLQQAVKNLLEKNNQINNDSNKTVKSSRSIEINKSVNKTLNNSLSNFLNNSNYNNIITNPPLKIYLKSSSLSPMTPVNKKKFKQTARDFNGKRSSTFSESDYKNENSNDSSKILKKKRKNFLSNFGDYTPSKGIFKKQNTSLIGSPKTPKLGNRNIIRGSRTRNGFRTKDNLFSLNKYKNNMILTPDFFNKKRKYNLLSTIDFNIQKNSQNINNPNAFYSFYFQSLIENEKKNFERPRMSLNDSSPKFRRIKK